MKSKLFHADYFMPDNVNDACKQYQARINEYVLSKHLREHINNQRFEDRSHTYLGDALVECVESLKETQRDSFEVELTQDEYSFGSNGWFVTKYCCRIPYDEDNDIVVAIRPKYKGRAVVGNIIVTAWMNSSSDHHYTLDTSKYCSKDEWEEALGVRK